MKAVAIPPAREVLINPLTSARVRERLKARADDGFLLAPWCESAACEAQVKEHSGGLTSRNRPFDLPAEPGKCVVCGEPSPGRMVFSKSY